MKKTTVLSSLARLQRREWSSAVLNRSSLFHLAIMMMILSACRTKSLEEDGNESNSFETDSETNDGADDPGGDVQDDAGDDTGSADEQEEDPEDETLRLDGQMDAEYTYAGSLGEFTDVCDGDAFIVINPDGSLEGEGTCAKDENKNCLNLDFRDSFILSLR